MTFSQNKALIAKWIWRYKKEPNSLWVNVVRRFHSSRRSRGSCWAKRSLGGVWNSIDKGIKALEKISIHRDEIIRRKPDSDVWTSDFLKEDCFSVALLRNRIDRMPHQVCDGFFIWSKSIPFKVSCFVWRARLNRIPCAKSLCDRGVTVEKYCGGCINREECSDHALVSCPFAKRVWSLILDWCGIDKQEFDNVKDITNFAASWDHGAKGKKAALTAILYGTLWSLWRARNDRVFNSSVSDPMKVFDVCRSLTFTWLKHRFCKGTFIWKDWMISPFICIL